MFALSWSVRPIRRRLLALATLLLFLASMLPLAAATPLAAPKALASHTPVPTTVTIAGSLQDEAGCAGDWDPGCAATRLTYDAADDVWQGSFTLPAGNYEYKVAINGGWDENYGLHAAPGGANIAAQPRRRDVRQVLLLARDALDRRQRQRGRSRRSPAASSPSWAAPATGSRTACAPGSRTRTATASTASKPRRSPPATTRARSPSNESWDVNYGAGGVQNGNNLAFTVPANGKVAFAYDATTHVLTITAASLDPTQDNNVEWDGLRHDSRDTLYRTPQGAVPAGTAVTLRLRTFHNDVTGVKVRFYSVDRGGAELVKMAPAATGVDCYEADLAGKSCDFWQATLPAGFGSDNLWYRFVVTDGTDTDYYADDTAALDGGLGDRHRRSGGPQLGADAL